MEENGIFSGLFYLQLIQTGVHLGFIIYACAVGKVYVAVLYVTYSYSPTPLLMILST